MVKPLDELHFYGFDSSSAGSLSGRQRCKSYPVQIGNRLCHGRDFILHLAGLRIITWVAKVQLYCHFEPASQFSDRIFFTLFGFDSSSVRLWSGLQKCMSSANLSILLDFSGRTILKICKSCNSLCFNFAIGGV